MTHNTKVIIFALIIGVLAWEFGEYLGHVVGLWSLAQKFPEVVSFFECIARFL